MRSSRTQSRAGPSKIVSLVLLKSSRLVTDGNNYYQRQLVQDVRTAVDDIHLRSLSLKKAVVRRPEEFVRRDARLGPMLAAIRRSGRRSFLLTNSDWWYTNNIMTFLLGGQSWPGPDV